MTPTPEHERAQIDCLIGKHASWSYSNGKQGSPEEVHYYKLKNLEGLKQDLATYIAKEVAAAREDELALFAQKFIKEDSVGSTPSDLVQPEPYIEADDDEIIAYVDERLAQLAQKPEEGGSRE